MPDDKQTYLEKIVREHKKREKNTRSQLKQLKKEIASHLISLDIQSRMVYAVRATIDMPELFIDHNWDIVGYSGNFLSLTRKVLESSERRENIKEFLEERGFNRFRQYLERKEALKHLPYEKGNKWRLRYKGPNLSDRLGESWIPFTSCEGCKWQIKKKNGKLKIFHSPHILDRVDCYLMSAEEFGSADEDVKVIFTLKTSRKRDNIRDLSLVLSGSSGREEPIPDIIGYTICSGAYYNTVARIQRQGANLKTTPEKLALNTEYQVTVERTGGKIRRSIRNLQTQEDFVPIEIIDSNAVYDRQNHIGFTTFCSEAEFYDIEVYTRKSRFSIDQFKIPFNVEVSIRDKAIEDRIFKLRIGCDATPKKAINVLMFEDITERKRVQLELEKSREQLRSHSAYMQSVREEERARIAREIHDELGQVLTAFKMDISWIKSKLQKTQKSLIEQTGSMLNSIDNAIKTVQRISGELRPGLLDELGLIAGIEWEAEKFERRTGVKCNITLDIDDVNLGWNLSTAVFRVFQETLTNIARHANAKVIEIILRERNRNLILKVIDDGIGIQEEKIFDPQSFGLMGIRERIRLWEGKVDIAGIQNEGTIVTVTIPLNRRSESK